LDKELQKTELHIVFVEDVPSEAAMVEAALRKDGLVFSLHRVDTKQDFLKELESHPDVILSDHGLPSFNGLAALELAHQKLPEVPFIFVTNALTREMEIEKLTPGVTDYIKKNQLSLLAPTIRRAIHKTDQSGAGSLTPAEREEMIAKLLALLAEYDMKGVYLPICASCKKIRNKQNVWQPPEVFFRDRLGFKFTHGMCPDCNETFYGITLPQAK
jgi:CheY-like chemotaxis protein